VNDYRTSFNEMAEQFHLHLIWDPGYRITIGAAHELTRMDTVIHLKY